MSFQQLPARRLALVFGVANNRSLAWCSALSLVNCNYDVVVTYQNERLKKSVERLVERANNDILAKSSGTEASHGKSNICTNPMLSCLPCDISQEESVQHLFQSALPRLLQDNNREAHINNENICLDALVHSLAYAPADSMKEGSLLSTTRESFLLTHEISAYSLISLARNALPLLSCRPKEEHANKDDGTSTTTRTPSITALTYIGSTLAIPNYNIMGPAKASLESIIRGLALELGPPPHSIRVNGVSAGPVSTMAAKGGIRGFSDMKQDCEQRSPLRRNISGREVGETVAYLASGDFGSSGITGQVIFVDAGYSAVAGP